MLKRTRCDGLFRYKQPVLITPSIQSFVKSCEYFLIPRGLSIDHACTAYAPPIRIFGAPKIISTIAFVIIIPLYIIYIKMFFILSFSHQNGHPSKLA